MDDNSYEAFIESLGLNEDSMEAALKSVPEPLVEEGAPYEVKPSEILSHFFKLDGYGRLY